MTQQAADLLKEEGNRLFKEGDYLKAAAAYTKAMKAEPSAVLLSNRSAALLKLNKLSKALADAEQATVLDPSFAKGWMRKALVLESQGQLQEALECFQAANQAAGGDNPDYQARIKALKLKTNKQQSAAKTAKPAAEQAALRYADSKLAYARDRILELGGSKFPPELHLLHPRGSQQGSKQQQDAAEDEDEDEEVSAAHPGMKELLVRAQHAFDAPDTVTMFLGEMRQQAADLQASAAVLVAPKSAVAFPQTWRQSGWQFGSHDGVFVQLQALVPCPSAATDDDTVSKDKGSSGGSSSTRSTVLHKTWFIRQRPDKPPSEPVELGQEFGLLPPLLK